MSGKVYGLWKLYAAQIISICCGEPAKNERIRFYGISEREKQSDALRAVWGFEIQIQEQGVLVQRVLRR